MESYQEGVGADSLVNKAFCALLIKVIVVLHAAVGEDHLLSVEFAVVRPSFLPRQIDVAESCNSTQLCLMLQLGDERFHTYVDCPFIEIRSLYKSIV